MLSSNVEHDFCELSIAREQLIKGILRDNLINSIKPLKRINARLLRARNYPETIQASIIEYMAGDIANFSLDYSLLENPGDKHLISGNDMRDVLHHANSLVHYPSYRKIFRRIKWMKKD